MITYELDGGAVVLTLRTSGTEPKIKFVIHTHIHIYAHTQCGR